MARASGPGVARRGAAPPHGLKGKRTKMRQLTSLDAQFLALEDGRTSATSAGLRSTTPRPRPAACSTRRACRAGRRAHAPAAAVPLAAGAGAVRARSPLLDRRRHFDLGFHVRELALPAPGDEQQLAEQVARIFAPPARPRAAAVGALRIHGLRSGRVAVMTKIHHAAVDGMSGPRSWPCCSTVARRARRAAGRRHRAQSAGPASSRCSAAASPACRGSRCALLRTLPKTLPTSTRCRRCATSPARRSSPRRRARRPRRSRRAAPTAACSRARRARRARASRPRSRRTAASAAGASR